MLNWSCLTFSRSGGEISQDPEEFFRAKNITQLLNKICTPTIYTLDLHIFADIKLNDVSNIVDNNR